MRQKACRPVIMSPVRYAQASPPRNRVPVSTAGEGARDPDRSGSAATSRDSSPCWQGAAALEACPRLGSPLPLAERTREKLGMKSYFISKRWELQNKASTINAPTTNRAPPCPPAFEAYSFPSTPIDIPGQNTISFLRIYWKYAMFLAADNKKGSGTCRMFQKR